MITFYCILENLLGIERLRSWFTPFQKARLSVRLSVEIQMYFVLDQNVVLFCCGTYSVSYEIYICFACFTSIEAIVDRNNRKTRYIPNSKMPESTWIRYWSDAKMAARCPIDVDPYVLAIWDHKKYTDLVWLIVVCCVSALVNFLISYLARIPPFLISADLAGHFPTKYPLGWLHP